MADTVKALKQVVRGAAKVVGGIAGLVFILAPVTNLGGWAVMAGTALAALVCFGAYTWSEPEQDDEGEISN